MQNAVRAFSPFEKTLFSVFAGILVVSVLLLLGKLNTLLLVEVPAHGGHITEGVVGVPRYINPLLAISDTDRDLTALVYAGLLRATPAGDLIPDLASDFSISGDGLTYTFTLRNDIFFHDGAPVTPEDVIFTITKAQDSAIKSPKRANWDGVTASVNEKRQIVFTLSEPYSPFLENTTLGILPKHIWRDFDAEEFTYSAHNTTPVGAGPFTIKHIRRGETGTPELYTLRAFEHAPAGMPYIETISFIFFPDMESLAQAEKRGVTDNASALSPDAVALFAHDRLVVDRAPLPRVFAVFLNQNQAQVFTYPEVRKALETAVNKEALVHEVLGGFGTAIDGPIPPNLMRMYELTATEKRTIAEEPAADTRSAGNTGAASSSEAVNPRIRQAQTILLTNGWKFDTERGALVKKSRSETSTLAFSLSTSNTPELKAAVQVLKETWEQVGAHVEVKIFEPGDLNQNVIRPRKFDALLFGEVVGRDLDLFAFWHSSQMTDPGLNIAGYANIDADRLLENARTTTDRNRRNEKYQAFLKEIGADHPAIFLYAPDFIYIRSPKIRGLTLGAITTPAERFLNVHQWYMDTEYLWDFLAPRAQ